MNRRAFLFGGVAGLLATRFPVLAQSPSSRPSDNEFLTDVPPFTGNVLLSRPTDRSITASVLLQDDTKVCIAYGRKGETARSKTPHMIVKAGEPALIVLDQLAPNAAYEYRVLDAFSGKPLLPEKSSGAFHTARPPGSSFTFAVQADSHLDGGCRPDLYKACLLNQLAAAPDFMIDLGDTFMTGKHPSRTTALAQYRAQRYYFGLLGDRVPSFLVVGNHDGEETKKRGAADPNGLAVWANQQRKRLFANPEPDRFYSGNEEPHPAAGLLQNYYAWTWGDALFVVLDPYWTSTASRGDGAGWHLTLGKRQYDFLTRTLRNSKARHKLIFIHQLLGGLDESGRGGVEAANFFEWGGRELNGDRKFAKNRPNWAMPIHQLLVETGVKIVFHGHDHFYAKQEKDGIIYQLVPQPAHRNFKQDHAKEYGYREGDFLPSSGHLRVAISPAEIRVSYILAAVSQARGIPNGKEAATYSIQS